MKIAIIGKSFRLPNNIDSFDSLHDVLSNKIECLKEHPIERFNTELYYDKNNNIGKFKTKKAGYVDKILEFDSEFFKISPKEAKTMDPQQRIMLELIFECILDSKIKLNEIKGSKTGVFMGSCSMEYFNSQSEDPTCCNEYFVTGGLLTLLSNRISFFYDLKGPSLTLDTACSSSGHAFHLACQSIINGESEMCFVGGSNILLSPETFVGFSQANMLSSDGRCKTFDDKADGYVRSEGFVIFLLKSLSKAIEDNNHIYAIVNNSSINQDGKTPSITMPNQDAQMSLLKDLYSNENLNDLVYVEAHGTGTSIGDFNETISIGNILGKNKNEKLKIGSIKTNVGHTEAASGLVSILKVCLMMERKELLPNINFDTPNQKINFENLNLSVVTKKEIIKNERILMGVNNFGFGGSNFHCILENYQNKKEEHISNKNKNKIHLLAIHGVNEESLDTTSMVWLQYEDGEFLKYLYNQNKNSNLKDLGQSKIYCVTDKNDFEKKIFDNNYLHVEFSKEKLESAFVFCGQGPQYLEMGYDLCENYPIFLDSILKCDNLWKKISGESFIYTNKLFLPKFKEVEKNKLTINEPIVAQPALFFFQVALVDLYFSYNIIPDAVIGHSAGELAAFYAAGAFDLKDCIKILYVRSVNQQKTVGMGNMLVVNTKVSKFEKYTRNLESDKLELACENDSNSIVISGNREQLDGLVKILNKLNIFNTIIKGSCPFHSSFQDIIKDEIIEGTKLIKFQNPKLKLISSTLGTELNHENYTNDYWWKNVRNKVSFYEAMQELPNIDIFVEVGPHPILANNIKNIYSNIEVLESGNRKKNSAETFLISIANLWAAGYNINLENCGIQNNTHYPKFIWNHKYFNNIPISSTNRRTKNRFDLDKIEFNINKYSYIKDHIIDNKLLFPTIGYFDIIKNYFTNKSFFILKNIEIKNMYLPNDQIEFNWSILNSVLKLQSSDKKLDYFSAEIVDKKDFNNIDLPKYPDQFEFKYKLTKNECYDMLKNKKFNFGENMKSIEYALVNDYSCLIKTIDTANNLNITDLDAGLLSAMIITGITNNFNYLPVSFDEVGLNLESKIEWVYTVVNENNLKNISINVIFYDKNFNLLGYYINCNAKNINYSINDYIYKLKNQVVEINYPNEDKKVVIFGENKINLPYSQIDLISYDVQSIIYTESIDTNLKKLKDDILHIEKLNNLERVFFILKNNHDGLNLGFLRTYCNESKKKISIIIIPDDYKNCLEEVNTIVSGKIEYNSEFIISDNKIRKLKLKKYDIKKSKFNEFYCNKFNSKIQFYPLNKFEKDYSVIVKNKSSALNFKDIMVLHGIVPELNIGYESAGEVIESTSEKFKIGDEVIVIRNKEGKCISNYLYCNEDDLYLKPKNLSYPEAASVGIIFSTAYICLVERGQIKKNDLVLIHSASGGIGQAAIQICKMIGARIIGTAGTEEKRQKLKSQFGLEFVTDSRNPEIFRKDILDYTNNLGVDVILNSLAGNSLQCNFDIIKEGGTIVEIGKRDSIENNTINLNSFLNSITYTSVHFDRLFLGNKNYIKDTVNKVLDLFSQEKIKPIDTKEYHVSEIENAVEFMSKGLHSGKIILNIDNWIPPELEFPVSIFKFNKFYLITGGLGGLGIELIKWMNKKGAKKFIITSRTGKMGERTNKIVDELKNIGCYLIIAKININEKDSLKYFLDENNISKKDIDGIFHLAGNANDNLIQNIEEKEFNIESNPKIQGVLNLGNFFKDDNLTYFITFSSISAIIGNPGQAIYAASNSFLDTFCNNFEMKCKKLISINVGAVGGTGLIHNNYKLSQNMKSNYFNFIHYEILFENLLKVLSSDSTINQICISNQEWNNLLINNKDISLLSDFKVENKSNKIENNLNLKEDIIKYVSKLVEVQNLSPDIKLTDYGVDSMMSIQISSYLSDNFSIIVSQLQILQGITINEIVGKNSNIETNEKKEISSLKKFKKKFKTITLESDNILIIESDDSENRYIFVYILFFCFLFIVSKIFFF